MQSLTESFQFDRQVTVIGPDLTNEIVGLSIRRYANLSDMDIQPTGIVIIPTSCQPELAELTQLLCEGVQIVWLGPELNANNQYRDGPGCWHCEEARDLAGIVTEITGKWMHYSVKSRFFNRGRYQLKHDCMTVLIATYRDIGVLHHTLDSVKRQTHDNWEIVIANDNPDPTSREQLATLVNRYDKLAARTLVIHNQVNVNQYVAMNLALSYSRGEYITIIGAGDVVTRNRFSRVISLLTSRPVLGVRMRFVRLRNYRELARPSGFRDFESTLSCKRQLYETYGFYDPVRCAGDSGYIFSVPRDKIIVTRDLTYLAVGAGMSTRFKTERVEYARDCEAFYRQHYAKGGQPVFNEPFILHSRYRIPKAILVGEIVSQV